jgi:hypothetical protein
MRSYRGTPDFGLVMQAREAIGANQIELGKLLGLSRRTMVRWFGKGYATMLASDWAKLAAATFEKDPELAQRLAERAGGTLVSLGIAPAPPVVASVAAPSRDQVDLLVLAGAEAAGVEPKVMRAALAAVFAKAAAMEVTVEGVSGAMAPAPAKRKGAS